VSGGVVGALAAVIDEAVRGLEEVEWVDDRGAVELRRAGRAFVCVEPQGASFRLGVAVAAAALRTPGAGRSSRGHEWVRLDPARLDRSALDRATSWTELAWRHAVDSG